MYVPVHAHTHVPEPKASPMVWEFLPKKERKGNLRRSFDLAPCHWLQDLITLSH